MITDKHKKVGAPMPICAGWAAPTPRHLKPQALGSASGAEIDLGLDQPAHARQRVLRRREREAGDAHCQRCMGVNVAWMHLQVREW